MVPGGEGVVQRCMRVLPTCLRVAAAGQRMEQLHLRAQCMLIINICNLILHDRAVRHFGAHRLGHSASRRRSTLNHHPRQPHGSEMRQARAPYQHVRELRPRFGRYHVDIPLGGLILQACHQPLAQRHRRRRPRLGPELPARLENRDRHAAGVSAARCAGGADMDAHRAVCGIARAAPPPHLGAPARRSAGPLRTACRGSKERPSWARERAARRSGYSTDLAVPVGRGAGDVGQAPARCDLRGGGRGGSGCWAPSEELERWHHRAQQAEHLRAAIGHTLRDGCRR